MPKIEVILINILFYGIIVPALFYVKGKYFFKWSKSVLRLMLIIYYLVMLIITFTLLEAK